MRAILQIRNRIHLPKSLLLLITPYPFMALFFGFHLKGFQVKSKKLEIAIDQVIST